MSGPSAGEVALVALAVLTPLACVAAVLVATRRTMRDAPRSPALSDAPGSSYAAAFQQIIWTADATGRIDFVDAAWVDYTAISRAEAPRTGWFPAVHPDDVDSCRTLWTAALETGSSYESAFRLKRACDGAYRWHVGRARATRDGRGAVAKWYGTLIDIDEPICASEALFRRDEQVRLNARLDLDTTARKRAEAALRASDELFRQVEEHAPIGLALTALDGSFIRVNPALCRLTGYAKAELLSMTFADLAFPAQRARAESLINDVVRAIDGKIEHEMCSVHKDGSAVWIGYSASLVRDEDGEALYSIAQIQDISARKAAETVIAQTQRAALAANEAKSRFLATMSHEIRTPMNGIVGMAELVSLSNLTPDQYECVAVIRDSGRSLLRVLNDILDFSKIEAGKLDLEIMDFDLRSQVDSIAILYADQARGKQVTFTTRIDEAIPPTVCGDPGRVRQIVLNLVGNAMKFTPAGGNVGLAVVVEGGDQNRPMLRCTVTDTGIGITPDARRRLFLPFSQLDDSTTRRFGGTGLGLSICKQLVEMMDGTIGVDSEIGCGSAFWFMLPLVRGKGGREADDEAGGEPEVEAVAPRRYERILLAEDNPVNTIVARRQFKALGFEITVVPNGRAAVEAVEREPFAIIFMDCHMPVLDGFDATREIRGLTSSAQRDIPIVAMTADAQAQDREACFVAGMSDYISKPAVLSDLRRIIDRWIPREALA